MFLGKTEFNITSAISSGEGSLDKEIKLTMLEGQSTTFNMTVLPSEGGKSVIMSKEMSDQGCSGTGSS